MLEKILDVPIHEWMEHTNSNSTIVLSTRIRLARNFKDLVFTNLNDEISLKKVDGMMRSILPNLKKADGKEYGNISLEKLSDTDRSILVEKHLISPMLADTPSSRSLVVRDDGAVAIMVNEEDHLRIQIMESGLQLKKALQHAYIIDDAIESKYDYAFSEHFGYLTACPTNVGTGLRASVMVHLPGLVMTDRINRVIRGIIQLGYSVRGLYGEGSAALGNLFQISNQKTMGISEEATIENLEKIILQLTSEEQKARQLMLTQDKGALEDRVWRAYGLLTSARRLTGDEALTYMSEVQLGFDLGILKSSQNNLFAELLVITRPNFLQKYIGKESLSSMERDSYRAQVVRDRLATCA